LINNKKERRWLVKGRRFFVPDGEGGNEKYIKAKKTTSDSEIISNFAAGNEKQDNTKKRIL